MVFGPGPTYQGFLRGCPALTSGPESSPERACGGLAGFLCFPELSLALHAVQNIAWKRKVGSLISQCPCFRLPCLSLAACHSNWWHSGFALGTGARNTCETGLGWLQSLGPRGHRAGHREHRMVLVPEALQQMHVRTSAGPMAGLGSSAR